MKSIDESKFLYHDNIISIMYVTNSNFTAIHSVHVLDIRLALHTAENLILTSELRLKRTKREIRTMDIHANIDYPLHVTTN